MRRPFWLLLVLVGLIAAAGADVPESDDLGQNRRLLEQWKADPEHYQRLRRDLADFYALPLHRQEQIRQLDRDLHTDKAERDRLWRVMERYTRWLEKLAPADRRLVQEAPAELRLRVVRWLRQREWSDRLPKKVREELLNATPEKRAERLKELWIHERRQRWSWQQERPGEPHQAQPQFELSEEDRVSLEVLAAHPKDPIEGFRQADAARKKP
jgi:hypothetical protein